MMAGLARGIVLLAGPHRLCNRKEHRVPGFKLMVLLDRLEGVSFMASPETEATLADAAKFLEPPQLLLVDERVVLPPGA